MASNPVDETEREKARLRIDAAQESECDKARMGWLVDQLARAEAKSLALRCTLGTARGLMSPIAAILACLSVNKPTIGAIRTGGCDPDRQAPRCHSRISVDPPRPTL